MTEEELLQELLENNQERYDRNVRALQIVNRLSAHNRCDTPKPDVCSGSGEARAQDNVSLSPDFDKMLNDRFAAGIAKSLAN